MSRKPHILIFNPDQWRGDAVAHMGNPAAVTPNLDRFAETEGVSFREENADSSDRGPPDVTYEPFFGDLPAGEMDEELLAAVMDVGPTARLPPLPRTLNIALSSSHTERSPGSPTGGHRRIFVP